MSFPCPNYKTDPAEYERMQREYRRANYASYVLLFVGVAMMAFSVGFAIHALIY